MPSDSAPVTLLPRTFRRDPTVSAPSCVRFQQLDDVCVESWETSNEGSSPVAKARYLVEAHLTEGRSVTELAKAHGVL